jgi:phospholipase/lecithinase/hemolysin
MRVLNGLRVMDCAPRAGPDLECLSGVMKSTTKSDTRKRGAIVTVLLGACAAFGGGPAALAQAPADVSPTPIAPPPGSAPTAASALFVLGDSLSDIGNAAALADYVLGQPFYPDATVGLCNPFDVFVLERGCDALIYRRTHATNGLVAVEVLAAGIGLSSFEPSFHVVPDRPVQGTDYAVDGAMAGESGVDDLGAQVDALLLDVGPQLPADALYLVMIGGNDGLAALRSAAEYSAGLAPASDSDQIAAAAVGAIGDAVDVLVGAGARRLIVANVPNLAAVPALSERASALGLDAAAVSALAADITAKLNAALAARLADTAAAYPDARIEAFDLFGALEEARLAASAAGKNVTNACFDSETYRESPLAERRFDPACAPQSADAAPRFDQFFFWDSLHPSADAHAAVGQALIDFVAATLGDEIAVAVAVPAAAPEPIVAD